MGNTEAALVLMLKNSDTGFFEKELGQYHIGNAGLVEGLHAEQTEQGLTVCLRVGVGDFWTNIDDKLFNTIYDNYEADLLPAYVMEFVEIDDCYNPAWEARFLYNPPETEDMIKQTLEAHRKALSHIVQDNID